MTDYSDLTAATQAVADPATSGADLAVIAAAQPSLHTQIAVHPNVYPDLVTWMSAQAAPTPAVSPAGAFVPGGAAMTPGGYPSMTAQVKKSRLGLVISVIVGALVVVGAGVGLLLWHPWSGSKAPELTNDQFASLLLNNNSMFGGSSLSDEYGSTRELASDMRDFRDDCYEIQDSIRVFHCEALVGIDSERDPVFADSMFVLTMTRQEAYDNAVMISQMVSEEAAIWYDDYKVLSSEAKGGLWYEAYEDDGEIFGAVIQYGNVLVLITPDWRGDISWNDIQNSAERLKEAITVAGKQ